MNTELTQCPNCNTALKSGLMGGVKLIDDYKVRVINEYSNDKKKGYCNKCGNELYDKHLIKLREEATAVREKLQKLIIHVPIVSIQSPLNWDYQVIGLVTGQSVTGTGFISEISSSWADLFGTQSNKLNQKLKSGEILCASQLRKQTLDLGGNAVVGVDIDYSEVGGIKDMLMVCMTGTAIKLSNSQILGERTASIINEVHSLNIRNKELSILDRN